MFFSAPMDTFRFNDDGSVSKITDFEPQEGFQSISAVPKSVIQKPVIDPQFFPKNNWKDFKPVVVANPDAIPQIHDIYPELFCEYENPNFPCY